MSIIDPLEGVDFDMGNQLPDIEKAITSVRCPSCGVVHVGKVATEFALSGLCPVCNDAKGA